MSSAIVFRGADGRSHMISEAEYKQQLIDQRRDDFTWAASILSGKAHMTIPQEDFSVTLCKKIVHGRDYWPEDNPTDKCKTCMNALIKEQKTQ